VLPLCQYCSLYCTTALHVKTFLHFFTLDIGRIILTLEGRLHLLKYIFSFGQKPISDASELEPMNAA